jgi:hypothetical protein
MKAAHRPRLSGRPMAHLAFSLTSPLPQIHRRGRAAASSFVLRPIPRIDGRRITSCRSRRYLPLLSPPGHPLRRPTRPHLRPPPAARTDACVTGVPHMAMPPRSPLRPAAPAPPGSYGARAFHRCNRTDQLYEIK